jgi:hypothetical protein
LFPVETLYSEAGFKNKVTGRSQSKEAVFLFDAFTYKQTISASGKADDYWLKHSCR